MENTESVMSLALSKKTSIEKENEFKRRIEKAIGAYSEKAINQGVNHGKTNRDRYREKIRKSSIPTPR